MCLTTCPLCKENTLGYNPYTGIIKCTNPACDFTQEIMNEEQNKENDELKKEKINLLNKLIELNR